MPTFIDTGPVPKLPRPPRAGDVWVLTTAIKTLGGDFFEPGEKFYLTSKTDDAPFKFKCPDGNWYVSIRGRESVWSSIPYMIANGQLRLEHSGPLPQPLPGPAAPSRFDRNDPI